MERKRVVYIHQDDDGCILGIYGTLNKAHKDLILRKYPVHRSFTVFKKWFNDSRIGGEFFYEISNNGAIKSYEII